MTINNLHHLPLIQDGNVSKIPVMECSEYPDLGVQLLDQLDAFEEEYGLCTGNDYSQSIEMPPFRILHLPHQQTSNKRSCRCRGEIISRSFDRKATCNNKEVMQGAFL